MVKFKNILIEIVLILNLISLITSQVNWVYYDSNTRSVEYIHAKKGKTATIALDFQDSTIPYYVRVTAKPTGDSSTPLICFSPKSITCQDNRVVLSKSVDKNPAILFVRREEFQDQNSELYIYATCQSDDCEYTILFEGRQSAEIDANSIFSYVVTTYNREMVYEIVGTAEEGSFLTIGVDGSQSVQLNVENLDIGTTELDNGRIITFPVSSEENSSSLAKLTVKGANVGEYLTLNMHIVTEGIAPDNLLYPNGPVVMGMLDHREGFFLEECFPISAFESEKYSNVNKYYLTGRIHSKYALFWLADEKGFYMEETEQEITDGQLAVLIENNGKKRSVCFEFSYLEGVQMDYVAYSISILEPTKLDPLYNFYLPQSIGETYRRMIPKGSYAVFHAAKIESSDNRLTYNVYNRKGIAETYVTDCSDYPNCLYSIKEIGEMHRPKQINKMTIYQKTITNEVEALSKNKNVIVVYCKDDDIDNKEYCEVDTSIFKVGQTINLVENERFSKYVLKEDKGIIKVDLKGGLKLQRLSVDIMVHSGDVNFKVNRFEDNSLNSDKLKENIVLGFNKYYLSNKIYYHLNLAQFQFDSLQVEYTAQVNSFFTIQYEYHSYNLVQMEETIPSGESYLVQIDPTSQNQYKDIHIPNYRLKGKKPFLVNFFALNCEFHVIRNLEEIEFFDGYAQEILTEDTQGYDSKNYDYKIIIGEPDPSNYNHKMCMLYVAGYESKENEYKTEIVVSENINQQVIFDKKFDSIRFLYPHADPTKDLAININIIDQAYYNINIYFNSEIIPFKTFRITRDQLYHISSSDILNYCQKDTLCSVIVEATYDKGLDSLDKTENPMIEITIRQLLNIPSYLQKSQAKRDFTCGDKIYYLYTDIGKNEIGEVSVNFLRDFGYVWAKIVRKDQSQADEEANWRGFFRMPSEDWQDSYLHNQYTKKIEFGVEETQDCIEGCYLLLSIQISQIGDYVEDFKFYPFSIITKITPNYYAYTDIPKVRIQVDEFIIGNVDISDNERIYQFYEVWLPHDSYRVDFDFQSKVAGLYINVGGTRPTTKNADFILLSPGRDSILNLDKYSIIKKAQEKKIKIPDPNSLQDINLVIGIWTDKADSMNTEIFSLCVHEPNNDVVFDINEVNSDQKVLCNPKYVDDGQFRCLFMLIYDDEDVKLKMPLIVHADSMNKSATTNIYASFIQRSYYDEYNIDLLRKNIPTFETAQYTTRSKNIDYIYTLLNPSSAGDNHYYFYVNVISNQQDDIYLISSMPLYNEIGKNLIEFYPNPSTEQLLFLSTEKLKLKFFTSSSIIANIVTLGGEADVSWVEDPQTVFYLRGSGDRLSLTSGNTLDEIMITKRTKTNNKLNADEDPGFVFYISYYERNTKLNFDEIEYGKSIEMSYRDTDLPIYLYSKIDGLLNDIIVAVTFKDSDLDTEGEFQNSPIFMKTAIVKENMIYKAKKNSEISPSLEDSIFGAYDPAVKTAIAFLQSDYIKDFNIKPEDNPTLYLSLDKSKRAASIKYEKFNIEAQFTKINGEVVPVEKTYNYGRHNNGYRTNYYKLRNDKNKNFMLIELAFNSNFLNFALNTQSNSRNNLTDLIKSVEKARGKILLVLDTTKINTDFIYLNIFKKNNNEEVDIFLLNYVFKYLNVEKENEYVDFKISESNELEIEESTDDTTETTTIKCKFNKIEPVEEGKPTPNITYFFKVVDNETHLYGEEYETIAVMESPFYTVYKRNPQDDNGKITLIAKGNKKEFTNWVYLQVIAQIQQDTILEYVAYKGKKYVRPGPEIKGGSGISGTSFAIFLVIILIIIVGLAVVVFIFYQKNKSLVNQVKHISFQQQAPEKSADPNLLLQKNQQQ